MNRQNRTTEIHEQLGRNFAPAWQPEPGDELIGELVEVSERAGDYGRYPILTVKRDDGSERAWHAARTVARSEVAEKRPVVGDHIGVRYLGIPPGKSYHLYKLVIAGRGTEPAAERERPAPTRPFGSTQPRQYDEPPFEREAF